MGDNYITMANIECELCEIDGEIVLCNEALIELTSDILPSLAQ